MSNTTNQTRMRPRPHGPMGHGPMGGGEKAKDFSGTISKLIRYISKYKIQIFVVMISAVCSTVFNVVGPKILGEATTEVFNGLVAKITGSGGIDFGAIGRILLILFLLYIASSFRLFRELL